VFPDRKTLRKMWMSIFYKLMMNGKKSFMEILNDEQFSITTNIYTSKVSWSYAVITATHLIRHNFKMHDTCLKIYCFENRYIAKDIKEETSMAIESVETSWLDKDMNHLLISVTADYVSNNKLLEFPGVFLLKMLQSSTQLNSWKMNHPLLEGIQ
jgi:hypothetical protein